VLPACDESRRIVIMKVYEATKVYGIYESQPVSGKRAPQAQAASQKDKLSLSKDAVDFQTVLKGLKGAPDVREDKVSELSSKYESGEYAVDPKDLAESLYKSGLFTRRT
jgi:negative regulator of flagellin synthesis FlgM